MKRVGVNFGVNFGVKLTANQERILDLLLQQPRMTASELAKITKISKRAIEQNLATLKKMMRLRRIGSDKAGRWEVLR